MARRSAFGMRLVLTAIVVALAIGALAASAGADSTPEAIQFNRDIRPILSDNCFQCHGPDAAQRKADLRLDQEATAKAELNGTRPIVPGQPAQSELVRRITSTDHDVHMPPADSGKRLTPTQIELLKRWVGEGAKWEKHWAFIAPVRPALPKIHKSDWARDPIDAFVLARLEAEGLSPAPEADKITLARRVTLDLTGLPPTPEEVDAFLADSAPDTYERLVDRLLASPRYGERMAVRWLDAARYADTSGYQTDGVRYMWRWRDWVIEAFNRNMPFSQFTLEQIAGDMLPGATLEQRIASGFNRNHRGNAEGGIIPEEYAVEYVVDRVDTTSTVWLGLTMACARCHDHKFDPITQKEFYQVFAFFNNVPEKGRAIKVGNSPPMIKAPTRDQQQDLAALEAQRAAAQQALDAMEAEVERGEAEWVARYSPSAPLTWSPNEALAVHLALDDDAREQVTHRAAETTGSLSFAPGAIGSGATFDGHSELNAGDLARFGYFDKFTLSAWVRPSPAGGTVLSRMTDQSEAEGYSLSVVDGKLQVNLVKRWLDDSLRLETAMPLATDRWQHVAVTYDSSRVADGVKVYVDGQPQMINILLDELNQSFSSPEPLRIGGGGVQAKFSGAIDEVRIYKRDLPAGEVALLATPETIDAILARPAGERSPRQAAKLREYYLAEQSSAAVRAARERVRELDRRIVEFTESFPTTMVMQELATPRETHILVRGQYDKPAESVEPAVPASLPALSGSAAPNRLALAHWLADTANPLAARVTVNRLWQSFFGVGLVKTADDFGAQGDPPSHPELLDWLATEFAGSGGDIKALQRAIVHSATYRQSSRVASALVDRDPDNRLLARGPRYRLSAEAIRDQALAVSGLLVERLGGPSVQPYQPAGLWKELTGGGDYVQDNGADLYRRSLYTFWKRTIAPPGMMTFDASGREACSVRETRTNTPLQALALLNEVTFVEAARMLAQRAMLEAESTPEERIARMFRLAVVRTPRSEELAVLTRGLERQLAHYRANPQAASRLLEVGESSCDPRLDSAELAAYAAVANLILNLDEVVTKE